MVVVVSVSLVVCGLRRRGLPGGVGQFPGFLHLGGVLRLEVFPDLVVLFLTMLTGSLVSPISGVPLGGPVNPPHLRALPLEDFLGLPGVARADGGGGLLEPCGPCSPADAPVVLGACAGAVGRWPCVHHFPLPPIVL